MIGGWKKFVEGDIVGRAGDDEHLVVRVDKVDDGQCILVRCIKADSTGVFSVGDEEPVMARNCTLVRVADQAATNDRRPS